MQLGFERHSFATFLTSILTGNLKHKDLTGQVVSSQAYLDEQSENGDEDSREVAEDDEVPVPNNEEDGETE